MNFWDHHLKNNYFRIVFVTLDYQLNRFYVINRRQNLTNSNQTLNGVPHIQVFNQNVCDTKLPNASKAWKEVQSSLLPSLLTVLRRVLDISLSLTGIILVIPAVLLYALFILIIFRKNPIFVQKRALSNLHSPISIWKLTTLQPSVNIEYLNNETMQKTGKPRLFFPFGKFLRQSGIDESLQFFSVLKGDMSLIGPRPLDFSDLSRLESLHPTLMQTRARITSKPGISGLWQLQRSPELSYEELIRLDSQYEAQKSFSLDLKLILSTVMKMIRSVHLDTLREKK